MRTKIVHSAVAKSAKFLPCTLISSDLLNIVKKEKERITDWQTEPDDNREAELPDPTEKTE